MPEIMPGIEPEKRDRILNAAIEEFATFPYEKASTNHIVAKAGISKGLLFHYFGSKQVLYQQLVGFVIEKMYRAIMERIDWHESDLFERIKQIALIKMEVQKAYPHLFDFLLKLMSNQHLAKAGEMIEFYKGYGLDFEQVSRDIYTRNIDYGKFRDPATTSEAINIVRWSLEKYGEELLAQMGSDTPIDLAQAALSMNHYMDILKRSFYKPGLEQEGHTV
ncbi:MAG: TetR/AcrR family transcriptional regulator [Clostridia bacterium]|nr:TetR/AcrR family transcriptional regulator [Clostridia bacterium]NCC75442.1 TetR/AcrR family transcriptional regulator [Clostridia bacterium]